MTYDVMAYDIMTYVENEEVHKKWIQHEHQKWRRLREWGITLMATAHATFSLVYCIAADLRLEMMFTLKTGNGNCMLMYAQKVKTTFEM